MKSLILRMTSIIKGLLLALAKLTQKVRIEEISPSRHLIDQTLTTPLKVYSR